MNFSRILPVIGNSEIGLKSFMLLGLLTFGTGIILASFQSLGENTI